MSPKLGLYFLNGPLDAQEIRIRSQGDALVYPPCLEYLIEALEVRH